MVNPFDDSFYKFVIGFATILIVTFALIYVVGAYSESSSTSRAAVEQTR